MAVSVVTESPRSGDELGWLVADLCRRTGAEAALIAERNGTSQPATVLARWPNRAGLDRPDTEFRDDFIHHVLASRRVTSAAVAGTHLIGAPLEAPGGRPAVLCAALAGDIRGAAGETRTVLEFHAHLVSFCLHHPGVLDELLQSFRLDGLTGCLNYSTLLLELSREISRSNRHELPLSCCFIDLDDFGAVNDRNGHVRANRVLEGVAATLAAGTRSSDTLGRYGGDEFVVILPETGEAAGYAFAERLRSGLAGATLPELESPIDASVGVAQWKHGWAAEDLLEAADQAMRTAKRNGGGNVVAASETRA